MRKAAFMGEVLSPGPHEMMGLGHLPVVICSCSPVLQVPQELKTSCLEWGFCFALNLRIGWHSSNSLLSFTQGHQLIGAEGNPYSSLLPPDPAFCSFTPSFRNESYLGLMYSRAQPKLTSGSWYSFLKWKHRGLGSRWEPRNWLDSWASISLLIFYIAINKFWASVKHMQIYLHIRSYG